MSNGECDLIALKGGHLDQTETLINVCRSVDELHDLIQGIEAKLKGDIVITFSPRMAKWITISMAAIAAALGLNVAV